MPDPHAYEIQASAISGKGHPGDALSPELMATTHSRDKVSSVFDQ